MTLQGCRCAFAALALAGCGYVGDPQPPALHIPAAVADLTAIQTGETIRVRFTIPSRTTDNLPIRDLDAVDLRFDEQPIAVDASEPGPVEVRVPLAGWVGKEIRIQVRVASSPKRWSEPSAAIALTAIPPLARPEAVSASSHPKGVRLQWETPPETAVRVSRKNPANGEFEDTAEVAGQEWVDSKAPFEIPQVYRLVAVVHSGGGLAESEPSAEITFTPIDGFPPSVPTNLGAVAGASTIELAWEQSPESDTAGYLVYRAPGGTEDPAAFTRVGEKTAAGSFSDSTVEPGKTYRYAVSAVDSKGNESERSQPLEATAAP